MACFLSSIQNYIYFISNHIEYIEADRLGKGAVILHSKKPMIKKATSRFKNNQIDKMNPLITFIITHVNCRRIPP